VIVREALLLILVLAGFMTAVSTYLFAFHGAVSPKEVASTSFAGLVGVYVGRLMQKGLARG
jgi:uncharacterized membrane protein YfcA